MPFPFRLSCACSKLSVAFSPSGNIAVTAVARPAAEGEVLSFAPTTPITAKNVLLSLRRKRLEERKEKLRSQGKVFVVKKKRRLENAAAKTRHSMFDEELDKYDTYEEYLDSLVSEEDHKYLQDEEMARAIAELGYR